MTACKGFNCEKAAGTLQCPSCLKLGIAGSFFCSQDCFKKSWGTHKIIHNVGNGPAGTYDPFPNFQYKGDLKACYPIGKMDKVPEGIQKPDYADTSIPRSEQLVARSTKMKTLDEKEIEGMRTVCRLGREVLDIAAAALRPGITTDEINTIVHNACLERNSYPSPLNYYEFPKSVCTSVNEIICHGIPDKRPLKDGDIVNLDVTLYHNGFHGDLNETYYVGDKAKADKESVNIVETARECLEKALALVKPGMPFRDYGITIEAHAKANNCSVVRTYCGHGINQLFHCAPNIPHYAKNKAIGVAKPGMCFTIEPMISGGDWRDVTWPDNWTSSTIDGKRSAQFEHTILVTETGCEILTARKADSPGGPVKRID